MSTFELAAGSVGGPTGHFRRDSIGNRDGRTAGTTRYPVLDIGAVQKHADDVRAHRIEAFDCRARHFAATSDRIPQPLARPRRLALSGRHR